jgi:threonine/homoserine/homoserine lactone efflux protein
VGAWIIPAVGVALSPLPVLGMLLVLSGRRPVARGGAFWIAWTIGVAAPTLAFVVLAERARLADDQHSAIGLAEITIGLVFLGAAVRLAFMGSETSEGSPWLGALDRSGPYRTAALALVLSSGNPKNLALMLAAAVAVARDGNLVLGSTGFILLAVSTVSFLLVGYAGFPSRSQSMLAALRAVIARNSRRAAMLVGFAVGAFFLADGIRSLD